MIIRESNEQDLNGLIDVEVRAFGEKQGPEIVKLVTDLFDDPSAKPLLSLVALSNEKIIGHILFTKAHVSSHESAEAYILAPLAVAPEAQSQGTGGRLIQEGLKRLKASGVQLVFVLGHPGYYPRYGFKPAGALGFDAPYPILEKNAGAWMVQELEPGVIGAVRGVVQCAEMMDRPEYWRE